MDISLDKLNGEQRKAIEEFRMRVKDILEPNMYEDIVTFYRFLEARDFRINDAESMFRKHIFWRKVNQIDSILEDFKPKEFFVKYTEPKIFGSDKEGNLVVYFPSGKINMKEFSKCDKKQNHLRAAMWKSESFKSYLVEHSKKIGKNAPQMVLIMNFDQMTFENISSKEMMEFSLHSMHIVQDNYPECMKSAYIINAPSYYVLLYSLAKAIMSTKMIMKIHIFGQSGWKEKLLEIIDADTLPAFLGGNRTDPDGNPLCKTIINHAGPIPPKYFLSAEERYFKDRCRVKKAVILSKEKEEIFVDVKAIRTIIHWEFYCKSNIGFGLLHKKPDDTLDEVIPIVKYDTSDGTEKHFHKTRSIGKYIIVFDNTFSWWSKKEVEYIIDTISPEV